MPINGCPHPHPDDQEIETPESDHLLAQAAALEAEARGLPDMLELEKHVDGARKAAKREMSDCRKWAAICEQRAQNILDGAVVPMERDREGERVESDHEAEARKWLDVAAKYRMAVEKGIDTQSKLLKMALLPATARYRAKQHKERALLRAGGKSN